MRQSCAHGCRDSRGRRTRPCNSRNTRGRASHCVSARRARGSQRKHGRTPHPAQALHRKAAGKAHRGGPRAGERSERRKLRAKAACETDRDEGCAQGGGREHQRCLPQREIAAPKDRGRQNGGTRHPADKPTSRAPAGQQHAPGPARRQLGRSGLGAGADEDRTGHGTSRTEGGARRDENRDQPRAARARAGRRNKHSLRLAKAQDGCLLITGGMIRRSREQALWTTARGGVRQRGKKGGMPGARALRSAEDERPGSIAGSGEKTARPGTSG